MEIAEYPAKVSVEYPEKLSGLHLLAKSLLGWIYVGFRHGIALWIYSIGVAIARLIASWAILFTGKFARGVFDFNVGFVRWQLRVNAYMGLMRDEYPPFSGGE